MNSAESKPVYKYSVWVQTDKNNYLLLTIAAESAKAAMEYAPKVAETRGLIIKEVVSIRPLKKGY